MQVPDQHMEKKMTDGRTRFFLVNLLKGFVWLLIIVGGYYYIQENYNISLEGILGSYYEDPPVIFGIFLGSEIIFGIIPPELFMIWSLRHEVLGFYIQNVALLALISYFAGTIGYYIGMKFSTTRAYRMLRRTYLKKIEKQFNRFGGFLIIVAALTPIPFSGVCMLVGAVKYPFRKFLFISMTRFVRFAVYAAIVWEANILQ